MQLVSVVPTDPSVLSKLGELYDSEQDKSQAFQYHFEVRIMKMKFTFTYLLVETLIQFFRPALSLSFSVFLLHIFFWLVFCLDHMKDFCKKCMSHFHQFHSASTSLKRTRQCDDFLFFINSTFECKANLKLILKCSFS